MQCLVPAAPVAKPPTQLRERVGIVRIERQRLTLNTFRLVEIAEVVLDRRKRPQRDHVLRVYRNRLGGEFERLPHFAWDFCVRHKSVACRIEVQPTEKGPSLGIAPGRVAPLR